jgi:SAM-dependent methyltransferase
VQDQFEEKYYRLEESHAWSVSRRDILLRWMRALEIPRSARVLEVGCSGGALLKALRDAGWAGIDAVETSQRAVELCHRRGFPQVRHVTGIDTGFPDGHFDVVIGSDVLEHIEDDEGALREWWRVLRPGGWLICLVPAYRFLWSEHDVANQHFRRYRRSELRQRVEANGFDIVRSGYWNVGLLAPTAAMRLLARVRPKPARNDDAAQQDDFKELNPLVNGAILALMNLENRMLAAGVDFPAGVSTWVIARRR